MGYRTSENECLGIFSGSPRYLFLFSWSCWGGVIAHCGPEPCRVQAQIMMRSCKHEESLAAWNSDQMIIHGQVVRSNTTLQNHDSGSSYGL